MIGPFFTKEKSMLKIFKINTYLHHDLKQEEDNHTNDTPSF